MPRFENVAPDPIRVRASENERIARRPKVAEEVTWPAALAFVMLLVAGLGVQIDWVMLQIAGFGSLLVLAMLIVAYWVNSNRTIADRRDEREEPVLPLPLSPPESIPVNQYGRPVTTITRRGPIIVVDDDFRWQFGPDDIGKLERWLQDSNAIRRDPNGNRPGMTELEGVTTGNYARLLLALERCGLVAGGMWTEKGEAWIRGEIGPVMESE